jgi:excisionase family DNA binding protein
MNSVAKIPESIVTSVSVLLHPYGIDFKELLNKAKDNFGKTETKYMTPSQAAQYCGFSPKTIRDKALAGEIDSTRIGHSEKSRVLILKSSLDAWLESFKS